MCKKTPLTALIFTLLVSLTGCDWFFNPKNITTDYHKLIDKKHHLLAPD
jgi:hypothetical protein